MAGRRVSGREVGAAEATTEPLSTVNEDEVARGDEESIRAERSNICLLAKLFRRNRARRPGNRNHRIIPDNFEQIKSFPVSVSLEDICAVNDKFEPIPDWLAAAEKTRSEGASLAELLENVPNDAELGRGAYGQVWRASHKETGQKFAVKNVKVPDWTSTAVARECEIAHRIRKVPHPCVVEIVVVEQFKSQNLYCFAMEFCSGGDLRQYLIQHLKTCARGESKQYHAPRTAWSWISQIYLGLEHLHLSAGMMLRDLKPENVVIDESMVCKLTDFGFGKTDLSSSGWTLGHPTGTPGYIAPEMLTKGRHDAKADLYSFGVLLWVMLSGGMPEYTTPRPPCRGMQNGQDYSALGTDWRLLVEAVKRQSGRAAMSADVQQLVLGLVTQDPQTRMDHSAIRQSACMRRVDLPKRQSTTKVRAWILADMRGD